MDISNLLKENKDTIYDKMIDDCTQKISSLLNISDDINNVLKEKKDTIDDKMIDDCTQKISSLLGISDNINGVNIIDKLIHNIANYIKSDNFNIVDITKQVSEDILKNKKDFDFLPNKFTNTFITDSTKDIDFPKYKSKNDDIVLGKLTPINNLPDIYKEFKSCDGFEFIKIMKVRSERSSNIGDIFCSKSRLDDKLCTIYAQKPTKGILFDNIDDNNIDDNIDNNNIDSDNIDNTNIDDNTIEI